MGSPALTMHLKVQRKFKSIDLNFTGGVVGNISYSSSRLYVSSGQPNNKIVNAADFANKIKKLISSGNKSLLLTVIDSQNRSRYVGVKIK